MGKIDLCFRKEDIIEDEIKGTVAVVFDILLATSTIAAMFHHGAREVIPVFNEEEALQKAKKQSDGDVILVGEYLGRSIEGFLYPFPTRLKENVSGKTVIFSTTNGTVALRKAERAKAVFAASMLNEETLSSYLADTFRNESILLVCSGSAGKFSLEDFYGAGSFLNALMSVRSDWQLTDAALSALYFYQGNEQNGEEVLTHSRVGQNLVKEGYDDEVVFTLRKNACPVIPYLSGKALKLSK